jgi:parvulin-like peptidyl-prolyl isomerase
MGDPLSIPAEIEDLRLSEIGRLFGTVFSEQLEALATGEWLGPLESGFGYHLVYITERVPGSKPDLEQVRDAVQRDWFSLKRREAVDGMYQRLAENYQVEIEESPGELATEGSTEGSAVQ